jgi:hypothetical protein
MPGNLAAAVVSPQSTVLPKSLCTQFVEVYSYPMLFQQYHDGTLERSLITDTLNAPRDMHIWHLARRLTPANVAILSTFFQTTVQGGLKPLYFYDPFSPAIGQQIGSNWDSTGVSTQGRYTVFFRGKWSLSLGIGRSDVPGLTLVEVA